MAPGHSRYRSSVVFTLSLALLGAVGLTSSGAYAQVASAAGTAPTFQVDTDWPSALPQGWNWERGPDESGSDVLGIRVNAANDHVWVTNRGAISEYDAEGRLLQTWTASMVNGVRYGAIHGMFIDRDGFVWTTGRENHVVLKFTPDGKLALVIGTYDETGGSDDPARMGRPAEVWVSPDTYEVFVADGYTNRRVVVYDALTGRYLRHWGADGEPPVDGPRNEAPRMQFSTPHGITGSRDGFVYLADRANSRVQVFDRMGNYVMEGFTREGTGGAFSVELSTDPEQQWVYVPDGTGHRVWILRRSDMQVVGQFGSEGNGPGQFGRPHNVAVDSKGNVYVAEASPGQRAQKFVIRLQPE